MDYTVREEREFKYIETLPNWEGTPLLLLHGLFGTLGNFNGIVKHFGKKINVVIPILPIFEMPLKKVGLNGYVEYVKQFVNYKQYSKVDILGNSLGGHIATIFTLENQQKVRSLILTGSSGLYESAMGTTFPKRGDYAFIKNKTEATFYNPEVATKELVDEVYEIVNDRNKGIRIVITAKSAIRNNISERLKFIEVPTLLVWGNQDTITPPFVGEKFKELIKNSQLEIIDYCGHAPMMEHPRKFNSILEAFFSKLESAVPRGTPSE